MRWTKVEHGAEVAALPAGLLDRFGSGAADGLDVGEADADSAELIAFAAQHAAARPRCG